MSRIQFRVTEEDYRLIRKVAQKQNITISEFVRNSVRNAIYEAAKENAILQQLVKKDNTEKMLKMFFEYQILFVDMFFIDKSKGDKLKQYLQEKLEEITK